MKKPVFRNQNARFVTPEMAMQRYNLCRESIARVAKEAGAFIKIGRCARIDIEKFDEYIEKQYTEQV